MEYGTIELDVLADNRLTPTAKCVYIALKNHTRPDRPECWPSLSRLADMTACGRTAIRDALDSLEANGFLITDKANGRATRYRLLMLTGSENGTVTPPTGSESVPVEDKTGTESVPVEQADRFGNRTAPVRNPTRTGSESEPEYLKEYLKEYLSQYMGSESEFLDGLLGMYKTAFGQTPDAKFREAALTEYRTGSRDLLGLLSVDVMIRAWRAFDKNEKLKVWSLGTMMLYVREYAARLAVREATANAAQPPQPAAQNLQKRELQTQEAVAEREKFFEKLSPEEQERFIAEAGATGPKFSDRVMRKIASVLAWKSRDVQLAGA